MKSLGVADYPDKELLENLWRSGMRAKAIIQWLEENNLPTPSVSALARYGQRNWSDSPLVKEGSDEGDCTYFPEHESVQDIQDIITDVKDSSLGSIERITISKTGYSLSIKPQGKITEAETIRNLPRIIPEAPREPHTAPESDLGPATHLIIPDTQIEPGRPSEHLEWISYWAENEIKSENFKVIHLGDHWNMGSLSSYDKGKGSMEGRRYLADIEAGNEAFQLLDFPDEWEKHFLFGNHECLDEDTQAITKDGLKYYWELEEGELVLSCKDDLTPEWLPIEKIHVYDYDGEMYSHNGRTGMMTTPNHRIVGFPISSWEKQGKMNWKEHYASEFSATCIPNSVLNDKQDDPEYSDLDIRLIAWAFSDSYRSDTGIWHFYQSEPKQDRIFKLLDDLGLEYGSSRRERDATEICGKVLKATPSPSYDIFLTKEASELVDQLIDNKQDLPDCVWSWSARQVRIFMDELIYTDGSVHKSGGSKMIYHSRDTRYDLQKLFMFNGISCTLSEYAPDYWRLNLVEHPVSRVEKLEEVEYSGKVWCITVDNGRFFAMANRKSSNGFRLQKPFLTGNCRVDKAVNSDIQLEGLLTTDHMLTPGWERHGFLDPVFIDGVGYSHYWYNPNTGKPYGGVASTRLKTIGHSFVMGHQQGLDWAQRYVAGKQQFGLISGSCYLHEEDYKGPQGNAHWQGIVVLHDVQNGSCESPEFVSLKRLQKYVATN